MKPTSPLPARTHFAGFDGLRLIAAVSVMFSHGFKIATGTEEAEPFVRLLGPGNIVGLYGVFTFFIISGFLLARSLSLNPSAITYTVNRVLRILPAFVFYLVVAILVIGPLFTALPLGEFFSFPSISSFATTSLNGLSDSQLPGVFEYGTQSTATVVNGSLWSLRYEALTYVFLLLLWTLRPRIGTVTAAIVAVAFLTWAVPSMSNLIAGVAYTLPYFAGGVLMHWVHRRYGTNVVGAVSSVVVLVAACLVGMQAYAFALCGAYLVIFFGERSNPGSRIADKIGDCSYGLYLYGWPSEQIVKQLTHATDPMTIFVLALPPAFVLAWISCHLVEQPAMRWRKSVAARVTSVVAACGPARGAAILGARVAFVAGITIILLSAARSWLFLESMAQLLVGVVGGAGVAVALYHLGTRPRMKRLFSRAMAGLD